MDERMKRLIQGRPFGWTPEGQKRLKKWKEMREDYERRKKTGEAGNTQTGSMRRNRKDV